MLTLMLGLLCLAAFLSSVVLFVRETNYDEDVHIGAHGAPYKGAQHIYQEVINQMARQRKRPVSREDWRYDNTHWRGATSGVQNEIRPKGPKGTHFEDFARRERRIG